MGVCFRLFILMGRIQIIMRRRIALPIDLFFVEEPVMHGIDDAAKSRVRNTLSLSCGHVGFGWYVHLAPVSRWLVNRKRDFAFLTCLLRLGHGMNSTAGRGTCPGGSRSMRLDPRGRAKRV